MEGGERKGGCGASVSPRTRARRGEESARDGGPGHCVGLATAAARWHPRGGLGRVAERRGHHREGKSGEEARARRVEASRQEVVRGGSSPRRAGDALHSGGEQAGRQTGEGKNGLFCNF